MNKHRIYIYKIVNIQNIYIYVTIHVWSYSLYITYHVVTSTWVSDVSLHSGLQDEWQVQSSGLGYIMMRDPIR